MQQQFLVGLSYGQESAKQNFHPTGVQRSKMHCSLYQPFNDLPYESSDQAADTSVPMLQSGLETDPEQTKLKRRCG